MSWASIPEDILVAILILFPNDDQEESLRNVWRVAAVNSHWRTTVLKHYCVFSASAPLHTSTPNGLRSLFTGLSKFDRVYTLYLRRRYPNISIKDIFERQLPSQAGKNRRGVNWLGGEWKLDRIQGLRRVLVEGGCLGRSGLQFLAGARDLTHLVLGSCRELRDYSPLMEFTSLVYLDATFSIHQVQEVSSFFKAVSSLASLKKVFLTGFPRLQSKHISSLGNLHHLHNLSFTDSSFDVENVSDPWLSSLSNCQHLATLTVSHVVTSASLSESYWIPADLLRHGFIKALKISKLSSLRELALPRTVCTADDIEDLPQLLQLTSLKLDNLGKYGWIAERLLDHVGDIVNLKSLSLRSCAADTTLVSLSSLSSLVNLESLDLAHNPFHSQQLEHISKLTQLRHLNFNHTLLLGPGLVHLQGLKNLQDLDIGFCSYQAICDASSLSLLSTLQHLRTLNVNGNRFLNSQEEMQGIFSSFQSRGTLVDSSNVSHANSIDWWGMWAPGWDDFQLPVHPHANAEAVDQWGHMPEMIWDFSGTSGHSSCGYFTDVEEDGMREESTRKIEFRRQSSIKSKRYRIRDKRSWQKRRQMWRKNHGHSGSRHCHPR